MFLSALLMATTVQAAPPTTPVAPLAVQATTAPACRRAGVEFVDQPERAAKPIVKKLGDLPPANHTLTVLRSLDGCPVSSTIRYNVDRPARR